MVNPQMEGKVFLCRLLVRDQVEEYLFELPVPKLDLTFPKIIASPASRYNALEQEPHGRRSIHWDSDVDLSICALGIRASHLYQPSSRMFSYLMVIRIAFLEYWCKHVPHQSFIPWVEWGPKSTRCFPVQLAQLPIGIYGSQLLLKAPPSWLNGPISQHFGRDETEITSTTPLHTVLIDFNPRMIERLSMASHLQTLRCVNKDAWVREDHPMNDILRGSLPFAMFAEKQADLYKPIAHELTYVIDKPVGTLNYWT